MNDPLVNPYHTIFFYFTLITVILYNITMLNLYATPRHLPINQRLKTNTSKPPTPK